MRPSTATRSPRRSLTRQGAWAAAITLGLGLLGLGLANNLLILLFSSLIALWLLDAVWGTWNLAGLDARRELPPELFAGETARGSFLLKNRRRLAASYGLSIGDQGQESATLAPALPAGATLRVAARWTFRRRGAARLQAVEVSSRFPFGLWERRRWVPALAEVVVYPAPRPSTAPPTRFARSGDGSWLARSGGLGDLRDLRAYRPGDPRRHIHWRISARAGRPIVVQRADPHPALVVVEVREVDPISWEAEISRACGEVLVAVRSGHQVGLRLPDRVLPSRRDPAWTRTLLEALALLPAKELP